MSVELLDKLGKISDFYANLSTASEPSFLAEGEEGLVRFRLTYFVEVIKRF